MNGPVTLQCPQCRGEFVLPWKRRKETFCGHSCAMRFHQAKVNAASKTPEALRKMADALRGRGKGNGYIKRNGRHEHRVVAEQMLGRPLRPGEIVHHKDENKSNNAPDNLEVLPSQSEHARLHFSGMPRPRPTHCKRGHLLSGENVYTYPDGRRSCIACRRVYDSNWKKAKRRARGLKRPGPKRGYKQSAEHIAKRFGRFQGAHQ